MIKKEKVEPLSADEIKRIAEKLESDIKKVSKYARAILKSNLKKRTIILLIWDSLPSSSCRQNKPSRTVIENILDAMANLDKKHLKNAQTKQNRN